MNRSVKPYQALVELGRIPEIRAKARTADEMLGIICVIAASPEPLELQDWFPQLWKQGSAPSFASETLAVDFASAALQFYENCLLNYQQSTPLILPVEQWLNEEQQVTDTGIAFASAYLSGFEHVKDGWQRLNVAPESEAAQLLQTTMLLLSKMATPDSNDQQMQALFRQLPDMQEIVAALPQLLSALGHFSVRFDEQ
ncbi:MAG: UPF0149 family protein [Psychromonas sp.]|nr:UPF0149 family protein [Psychromonas sp.]